jgi:phosphohistidine phosphatase SixA
MRRSDPVRAFRFVLVALLLACLPAQPSQAADEFWTAVKKPGAIVLLRHSYAPDTPPDTDLINLKNCATQRNLDDTGRAQARRIGDEFRKNGIKRIVIHSSQYCRALDTAKLLNLGPMKELPVLNQEFLAKPFALREAADKSKQFMKGLPAKQVTLLVSHVSNIQAIAGVNLTSGEMAVVRIDKAGEVTVAGRLMVK